MKKYNTKNKHGFTLVELLVVISIIGLLAAFTFISFSGAKKQARDTQRKSDLKQYQSTLETFANANGGLYPYQSAASGYPLSTICSSYLTPNYASLCSEDPLASSGTNWYSYITNGVAPTGSPTATKYALYISGGLEATPSVTWIICSNGNSGTVSTTNLYNNAVAFCEIS